MSEPTYGNRNPKERDGVTITVDSFLQALRQHESGGNYTARSSSSTASGAYQYLDSTWNGYGGYRHAWQAPPAVQDARARADVNARLRVYGGDWSKVAAAHFAGAGWVAQHPDPSTWNVNPAPGTQNPTVSAYVASVLGGAGSSSGGVGGNTSTGGSFTTAAGTTATTVTGSQQNPPDERPKDWIGTLDALLNPAPAKGSDHFWQSVSPSAIGHDVGAAVELVAARTGIALLGLIVFAAGLLLAVGPEVLNGAARSVPAAEALAATVEPETHSRRATGIHGENEDEEVAA